MTDSATHQDFDPWDSPIDELAVMAREIGTYGDPKAQDLSDVASRKEFAAQILEVLQARAALQAASLQRQAVDTQTEAVDAQTRAVNAQTTRTASLVRGTWVLATATIILALATIALVVVTLFVRPEIVVEVPQP